MPNRDAQHITKVQGTHWQARTESPALLSTLLLLLLLQPVFPQHFLAAAACGSQLHIIPDAHHLQFCSAGSYVSALLDTADNLFTDAGMSHMGATLLLALYLYLAGCKASGRPLPASAALGCNNSDERVALFDELYHHMLVSKQCNML
jgi:hypothetical protein